VTLIDPAACSDHELLTPGQAAALLGVTRGTVYRWVGAGELPALRAHDGPSAPIRISRSELWHTLHARASRRAA
jgi:excisionase family DNA binding protein